jgi:drug/metabolite transporter (DMT)-like permease
MSRFHANILLLLVAVIWGSAFVAQSVGMSTMGPLTFTGVRFLMGALVVTPLMWREWRGLQRLGKSIDRTGLLKIGGLGILLALGALLQQIGIVHTTVTNAGFLTSLYVPLVPVLGWLLLSHRPHWSVWPSTAACLYGAYLLAGVETLAINVGDVWVLASTIPWALHVLLVGGVAHRMAAPFIVAGGQFLVCGLVAVACSMGYESFTLHSVQAAIGPLLYTGVISVGVAYTAQVVAQRYAFAADAAIVLSSETLFAALFGFLWMNERLNTSGILGCGLIFASMLAVQLLPLIDKREYAQPHV